MLSGILITIINIAVDVYTFALLVYCVFSFFPSKPGVLGRINYFLCIVCDPVLNLFRKFIPPIGGMLDISPIVALLAIQVVARALSFILYMLRF